MAPEFNFEVQQSFVTRTTVPEPASNKAFEYVPYAHRTASPLRRAGAAQLYC